LVLQALLSATPLLRPNTTTKVFSVIKNFIAVVYISDEQGRLHKLWKLSHLFFAQYYLPLIYLQSQMALILLCPVRFYPIIIPRAPQRKHLNLLPRVPIYF
jgi:hypothetical protein